MGKRPSSFISQIQAEGQRIERSAEREEEYQRIFQEAKKLVDQCPFQNPQKQVFIRNLTTKALRGEMEQAVFALVIKLTNGWLELELCLPRAEQLALRRKAK